ncbi:MAG: twin transmembrane helix small protein [Burkholderiales bacterium]|nr:twin transmembrane helix small protein [Burkholderiales bacterium]
MNALTILIILALAATIFSLVAGVSAMATHGEVGHHSSNDWMFRRVGFQALTVVLLVLAMIVG